MSSINELVSSSSSFSSSSSSAIAKNINDIIQVQFNDLNPIKKNVYEKIQNIFQTLRENPTCIEDQDNLLHSNIYLQIEYLNKTNQKESRLKYLMNFIQEQPHIDLCWPNIMGEFQETNENLLLVVDENKFTYQKLYNNDSICVRQLCFLFHLFPWMDEKINIVTLWKLKDEHKYEATKMENENDIAIEQFCFFTLLSEILQIFVDDILEKESNFKSLFYLQCLLTFYLHIKTSSRCSYLRHLTCLEILYGPILTLKEWIHLFRPRTRILTLFLVFEEYILNNNNNNNINQPLGLSFDQPSYDSFNTYDLCEILIDTKASCLAFFNGLTFPISLSLVQLVSYFHYHTRVDHLEAVKKILEHFGVPKENDITKIQEIILALTTLKTDSDKKIVVDCHPVHYKQEIYLKYLYKGIDLKSRLDVYQVND